MINDISLEIEKMEADRAHLHPFRENRLVKRAILILQNKLDNEGININVYQALEDYIDAGLNAIKEIENV